MNILNLTNDIKPDEFIGFTSKILDYEYFQFSGGEPHIKIHSSVSDNIIIIARIATANDFMKLCVANNAIEGVLLNKKKSKILYLTYFPGGRQDRRVNYGEPLTVKVYADIINSMNFDKVFILDPHSDVTTALVNNSEAELPFSTVSKTIADVYSKKENNQFSIIIPDQGATKRVNTLVSSTGLDFTTVQCLKHRNFSTGKIDNYQFYSEKSIEGNVCLVIDDICDGGATFIELAKQLKSKNVSKIYLYVTHGIFSKGLKELSELYDGIYTTNSIRSSYDPTFSLENDKYMHKLKIFNL